VIKKLERLHNHQPNNSLYVAECWSGSVDHWGVKRNKISAELFEIIYEQIVFKMNPSVNIYMFIGGTNFGFMSCGGDYDAPLSESDLKFFISS
jgi:beta-galactosidase